MEIDLDNGGFIVSDEEDNLLHSPGGETSSSSGDEGQHLSQTVDYQDLELAQRPRQGRHAARPSRMTAARSTIPTLIDRGGQLPHTPLPARCRRSSRVTNTWSSGGRTVSDNGIHMYVNPAIRRHGQPSLRHRTRHCRTTRSLRTLHLPGSMPPLANITAVGMHAQDVALEHGPTLNFKMHSQQ